MIIDRGHAQQCDGCGKAWRVEDHALQSCRGECGNEFCEDCAAEWYDDADLGHAPTCLCHECKTAEAAS